MSLLESLPPTDPATKDDVAWLGRRVDGLEQRMDRLEQRMGTLEQTVTLTGENTHNSLRAALYEHQAMVERRLGEMQQEIGRLYASMTTHLRVLSVVIVAIVLGAVVANLLG